MNRRKGGMLDRRWMAILATFLIAVHAMTAEPKPKSANRQPPASDAPSPTRPKSAYDEIFLDPQTGQVRPQYREVYRVYQSLSPERRAEIERNLGLGLGKYPRYAVLPGLLTESESRALDEGIEQRARAIRAFLIDLHSGKKRFLKAGIIPEAELEEILRRSWDYDFVGKVNPKSISVTYAPDMVRIGPKSAVVLEDNTDDVGGRGTVEADADLLLQVAPELREVLKPLPRPETLSEALMKRFRARAHPAGGKVVYWAPGRPFKNQEYQRLVEEYRKLGAEVVSPFSRNRLVTKEEGIFIRYEDGTEERVGFVMLGTGAQLVDWKHPANELQWLLYVAEVEKDNRKLPEKQRQALHQLLAANAAHQEVDLKKLRIALRGTDSLKDLRKDFRNAPQGVVQAILDGKVAADTTPGCSLINDKAFYRFIPKLIRFYLKEKPKLRSLRTERLYSGDPRHPLRDDFIRKLRSEWKNWVLKPVDGFGGGDVTVGNFKTLAEWDAAMARAAQDPKRFIVQEFQPMAEADGNYADIRGYAEISGRPPSKNPNTSGVRVLPGKLGRLTPKEGSDGRVNAAVGGSIRSFYTVANPCRIGRLATAGKRGGAR